MHLGNLVSIDDGTIYLTRDLLSPLHIHNKSTVYGLYYPASHANADHRYVFEHDFMFTPVPPRMWYSVARFTILLNHVPGCIARVTDFLSKNGVNIITAESTRAGHRLIYLTLTLEFESLSDKNSQSIFNVPVEIDLVREHRQVAIRKAIDDIKAKITNDYDLNGCLFEQKHGIEKFGGIVDAEIVNSLQFFYDKVGAYVNEEIYHPFPVTVKDDKIVFGTGKWWQRWKNILQEQIPTYGFAATSTRDISLRISVLPKSQLDKLKQINVKYSRKMPKPNKSRSAKAMAGGETNAPVLPCTSKGVMAFITTELKTYGYNIWLLYNCPRYNNYEAEEGYIRIIAQDIKGYNKERDHCNEIQNKFLNRSTHQLPYMTLHIKPLRIARFPIFVSLRSEDKHRHTYRQQLIHVGREFGLHENDFVFFDSSRSNGNVSQDIINTMADCCAMIQIHNIEVSNDYTPSVWLQAECLLAKSMSKPYSVIIHKEIKKRLEIEIENIDVEFHKNVSNDNLRSALKNVTENIS